MPWTVTATGMTNLITAFKSRRSPVVRPWPDDNIWLPIVAMDAGPSGQGASLDGRKLSVISRLCFHAPLAGSGGRHCDRRRPDLGRRGSTATLTRGQVPHATTIQCLVTSMSTGKLEVTSGDRSCSLYFLFGRLFHAENGSLKGEDALHAALSRSQASLSKRSWLASVAPVTGNISSLRCLRSGGAHSTRCFY